jgi:8-oxo-dGTP pyrophosphatase MutT (NUDIX family)
MNNKMSDEVPGNARLAARVILLDDSGRVLYCHAAEPKTGKRFWVMPGGGLRQNESFEDAAIRETYEETGISIQIGPCVWTRRHKHMWNGKPEDQYERYFVAWTSNTIISGNEPDEYISEYRWWTIFEIEGSAEDFAPRQIRILLPPILRGEFPNDPFDCGV